jgi:hypothetical protein
MELTRFGAGAGGTTSLALGAPEPFAPFELASLRRRRRPAATRPAAGRSAGTRLEC